jgi:hypothetical protein
VIKSIITNWPTERKLTVWFFTGTACVHSGGASNRSDHESQALLRLIHLSSGSRLCPWTYNSLTLPFNHPTWSYNPMSRYLYSYYRKFMLPQLPPPVSSDGEIKSVIEHSVITAL